MNTSDLASAIAEGESNITKTQAKQIVDSLFKAIEAAAVRGDEISIPGFGKFKVQDKPARTGRNPSTGATIQIAATRKVVFQPAKALKDAVAG
jgi:DNA-binding protein HU-beta